MLVVMPAVVLLLALLTERSQSQLICPYCNPNYGETPSPDWSTLIGRIGRSPTRLGSRKGPIKGVLMP